MGDASNPAEFVGCTAAEELLTRDAKLPAELGRPEPIPPSRVRGRVVGVGVTFTALTLFAGIALIAVGAIDALSSGLRVIAIAGLALGAVLLATHWGWVHVAEAAANALERRRNRGVVAGRRAWLEAIEPYARGEVTTSVRDDGSISIVCVRHRPVRSGERSFTFVREILFEEVHSGDEASAAVAERAESLRRQAAADTARERRRFEVAADAYETALLERGDDEQRLAAVRQASAALSDQINSNLRDPPLVE